MERRQVLQRILWRSALVAGVLVALGALNHETERIWREPGRTVIRTEGAQHWAGLAMLCGLLAIGAIWEARRTAKQRVRWLQASAALFLVSAVASGGHWLRLIDERATATGYDLAIATGLPVTATASIVGAAISLVLIVSARQQEIALGRQTEPSSAKPMSN